MAVGQEEIIHFVQGNTPAADMPFRPFQVGADRTGINDYIALLAVKQIEIGVLGVGKSIEQINIWEKLHRFNDFAFRGGLKPTPDGHAETSAQSGSSSKPAGGWLTPGAAFLQALHAIRRADPPD